MKSILFLFICLLQGIYGMAQSNAKYDIYTNRIKQFSKPSKVLYSHVDPQGNGSIEFTNAKKQILRFRLKNQKPEILHGGITFQLFYYNNEYLQRIETFDANGNLAAEHESNNEAAIVFIIEKPELYLKKKKLIDSAEGNIDLKDDTTEKIIRIQLYDQNNLPIKAMQSNYISSKMYWDYNVRMYWP